MIRAKSVPEFELLADASDTRIMIIDSLKSQTWTEDELCKKLALLLHENFEKYQDKAWFIKIDPSENILPDAKTYNGPVHISWVKEFNTPDECFDFFFDTKYERACILVDFRKNQYTILCWGFCQFIIYNIREELVYINSKFEVDYNCELIEMIPRALLDGFDEIESELKSS